ncbi:MAG: hypothetical protein HY897_24945 [Deltaproteobacteria bacterium]|nr:hypothetical protein [Deltaproteobacteria bacterium]
MKAKTSKETEAAPEVHATLEKKGAYRVVVHAGGRAVWTFVEPDDVKDARVELKKLKTGKVKLKHINAIIRHHGLWLFRGEGNYFYQRTDENDCSQKVPPAVAVDSVGAFDGRTWHARIDEALVRWYSTNDRVAATLLRAKYGF